MSDAATPYRWGMVVDLDRCTGCQACVVACRAENNVRTSDEDEMRDGRAISWIRIERYWEGEYPNVRTRFVPVMCQHCGDAPCEPVCPVYASYHTPEGLNAQVYNRCIGVRYCGNNCPYIARQFNWFDPTWPAPLEQQLNPDVTVRQNGIMEKCTFCVQRIRAAKEEAEKDGRRLRDGDVTPACVQSCPSSALVFGDRNDPASRVSTLSRDARAFQLLEDLGTHPAVTYLKKPT
ncbi:MAG TPA: 4Fe-4S dicluster domain-containing protein [Nitrospirales bacterium]|nr:4Fe-4S dicluster domain-containing protein [Nitrospirales bacterium]